MFGQLKPSLGPEKRREIEEHIGMMWRRSELARGNEINTLFPKWDRQYRHVPNQKSRNFPWPNASNMVVPVIRMFIDTFVSRTLNIIFNTRPLVAVSGFAPAQRRALENYLDLKCRNDWDMWNFAKGSMIRGNKYGTNLSKVFWVEDIVQIPQAFNQNEAGDVQVVAQPAVRYSGPKADYIAFDDWFVYPATANNLDEVEIVFHRLRYTEDQVARMNEEREWGLDAEEINNALRFPADSTKRTNEQSDAGISDGEYRELQIVECHFDWEVQGETFRCVAEYEPVNRKMVSFGLDQTNPQVDLFHVYRPFPRDDIFSGESMAQILSQGQEEISSIHNDRRNLSVMSSAPLVLTKEGTRHPGAGNAMFYPGKNYTLEDMDDLRVENIGGNYQGMIEEENYAFQILSQISGITPNMTGMSQGKMGKGGVYNAQGTMAMMAEGNQRQDTNIKDFRLFLGGVIKAMFALQREYGRDDPTIAMLSPEDQQNIAAAFEAATPEMLSRSVFEVRASDAAMNKEARKSNLMVMANTLSQFAQQQQQLLNLALDQGAAPGLKQYAVDTLKMQHEIAKSLVEEFELTGMVDVIPNAERAIQAGTNRSQGVPGQQPPNVGGMGGPQPPR